MVVDQQLLYKFSREQEREEQLGTSVKDHDVGALPPAACFGVWQHEDGVIANQQAQRYVSIAT